jgi:DNA helicase-4
MSIQKCDKCRDGYLIVKQGKNSDYFLGCTNYKSNGTGCSRMISKKYFYEQMGYKMEEPEAPKEMKPADLSSDKKTLTENKTFGNKTVVNAGQNEETVEIVRAEIPSVMYETYDLNELVFLTLKALQNVSRIRYYGVTMLTDILKGAVNKKIVDNKLDMLPEYGALKDLPRETIQTMIEWMISEHLILKTKEKYPVLHSTYEGLHYSNVITEGKLKKLQKLLKKEMSEELQI